MKGYRIAIVGATGLVGQEFIKILEQRQFPISDIHLYASDRSAGKKLRFNGRDVPVKEMANDSFKGVDIAFFSAGADISKHFSPLAAQAGTVVIDNSAAFRMSPSVPLVVPEVNAEDIRWHKRIIANPNCSTIQMVVALFPLHKVNPIKRIIIDTYQSVSGTGSAAIEELTTQVKQVAQGQATVSRTYPHQIAYNVIPEIDMFLENGYTREEWKMVEETRKIMHASTILVSATCARVPVLVGHSEAVHVEFTRPMSPAEAREILSKSPGVKVVDDPQTGLYPHAWMVAGKDDVWVGRIRSDVSHPNGLAMWIVADNVRKGAALNAIQIAEEMISRNWLRSAEE